LYRDRLIVIFVRHFWQIAAILASNDKCWMAW